MENRQGQGYVSEKILDSFISGTISIYYGGYMVDEFINPKAFILIRGESDIKQKIEYIKKIDNDDNLYRSILKENLFINFYLIRLEYLFDVNDNLEKINTKERIKFFRNIFRQEKSKVKRIDEFNINTNICTNL